MATLIDLTGKKYGKLRVVARDHAMPDVWWVCRCDCGSTLSVRSNRLREWKVYSCGCVSSDKIPWMGKEYRSKYEVFCAMYLVSRGIRFQFEPGMYRVAGVTPRGRVKAGNYLPDFHLIDTDEWWEVKGRPARMWKFESFKRSHKARLVEKKDIEVMCGVSLSKLYRLWKKEGMDACYDLIAAGG